MKIDIRKSFVKDADKLPAPFQKQLYAILAAVEKAESLNQITDCKKMSGHKTAYRIRMGQYRIGFYYENKIAEFVRVLHRKEIYRYFPPD